MPQFILIILQIFLLSGRQMCGLPIVCGSCSTKKFSFVKFTASLASLLNIEKNEPGFVAPGKDFSNQIPVRHLLFLLVKHLFFILTA